ncbi:carcinoembryonic antigen-related cell adhesion molecule 5 [Engraulis encrasicolus]|uniref:carcinoembryonic antigen-related cell adhesion molecule 5 n=1 Tax=Engraulis encrasicolus TaxID=184585 RepID=UPI002FD53062
MDFINPRLCLLLLSALACCSADLLPKDKIKGVIGKMVKFETTYDMTKGFITLIWNQDENNIVTCTADTIKIGDAFKDRVSMNRTTGTMTLGPLASTDSGAYQLSIVTKDVTTLNGETTLEVLEPVSDVAITSDLPEAVELNSTVVLTCAAKGSFLKFTWMNGSAPVAADGKRLVLSEKGDVLTVKEVLRTDLKGPITCKAGNDLETETSAAFSLPVSYGPESVVLTQTPKKAVLATGSNVTLSCSSVSSPEATYIWLQNGAVMKDQTAASIVFDKLKEKDGGNYTCQATNAKTKRYAAAAAPTTFSVQEPIKGTTITRVGGDAPLLAGKSSVNLTCGAESGTVSSKLWSKDGAALATSDRMTMSKHKDILVISPVQKEDAGTYKCELRNDVNSVAATYTMVVNYGPEVTAVEGPDAVEIHDKVEIKCLVNSHPAPTYQWKLNDTVLSTTSATVVIENPRYKDSGIYTCIATNAVTNATSTSTHRLDVKEEGALDEEGLSGGAIAGIIIGVLIALGIVIGVIMHMRKKKDIPSPY